MNIIKQIEVMDAQKVDAFIMANGKFFPDYQVAAIRDMLLGPGILRSHIQEYNIIIYNNI